MGKTDMSYYKDLLIRIGGATLGRGSANTGSGGLVGAAEGAKALKDKIIKKKKGGKVK